MVSCPQTNQVAVGSDYLRSGKNEALFVTRALLAPGTGLTRDDDARFFVVNFDSVGVAIKPIVGCVSRLRPIERREQSSRFQLEVRQRDLTPSKPADYLDQCKPGQHLVEATPGVLFHTEQPPSARELSQVSVASHLTADRAQFAVRIGPDVSANTRVTLQMTAVCRA